MLVPVQHQCSLRSPSSVDPTERPTSPSLFASWASDFPTRHFTKCTLDAVDGEHGRNTLRLNEAKKQLLRGLVVHYVEVHGLFFLTLRSMMSHPCLERYEICRRPTELPAGKVRHVLLAVIVSTLPNTTTRTHSPEDTRLQLQPHGNAYARVLLHSFNP